MQEGNFLHRMQLPGSRGVYGTMFIINGILAVFIAVSFAFAIALNDPPDLNIAKQRQLIENSALMLNSTSAYFLLAVFLTVFWIRRQQWAGYGIVLLSVLHLIAALSLLYFVGTFSPIITSGIFSSSILDVLILWKVILSPRQVQ